jgi:glycogen phosphorylase
LNRLSSTSTATAASVPDARAWSAFLQEQLRRQFAKRIEDATPDELFRSAAAVLRPVIVNGLMATEQRYNDASAKSLYYLSMEFLLGRSLANNLHNLGLYSVMDEAFANLGLTLSDVLESEPDAALGNGGLGRLRLGPIGCLFSRFSGNTGHAGLRLRH